MQTTENEKPERKMNSKPPPPRFSLPPRIRVTKTLPTDRLSVAKQLDILRAYGASYDSTGSAVTNDEVAVIVELATTTVSLSNAFLVDVGLIQRGDAGYTPSPEVIAFCHAHGWDEEKAPHKLGPVFIKTWFAQALIPKLKFRSIKIDDAVQILAEASTAGKDYFNQLRMLVDFLSVTGVVINENGEIRIMRECIESENPTPPPGPNFEKAALSMLPPVAEKAANPAPSAGAIGFEIKVNVSMAELSGWGPERITAFFNGVAQVLAAKGAAEKEKQ